MIRSVDSGHSWTQPITVIDTPFDDRDAAVIETPDGNLLLTWFTSTAWQSDFADFQNGKGTVDLNAWTPEKIARWEAAEKGLSPENSAHAAIQKKIDRGGRQRAAVDAA